MKNHFRSLQSFKRVFTLPFLALVIFSGSAGAAPDPELNTQPELLSLRAFLESTLNRRISGEVQTMLLPNTFVVGSLITLEKAPPVKKEDQKKSSTPVDEYPLDLLLGTLDLKDFEDTPEAQEKIEEMSHILKDYRLSSIQVTLGLDAEIPVEVKDKMKTWLEKRVKDEFGTKGTALIESFGQTSVWESYLKKYQSFAGLLALAVAVLIASVLGSLAWLMKKTNLQSQFDLQSQSSHQIQTQRGEQNPDAPSLDQKRREDAESERARQDLQIAQEKIKGLLKNIPKELNEVTRNWCNEGEKGYQKLSCLAETMGPLSGKVPIPDDAKSEVAKTFQAMSKMDLGLKAEILNQVYWDLLSVLNLGSETLSKPFGYLGSVNVGTLREALVDQNPKLNTLVTLFMPEDTRRDYIERLDTEGKRALLISAANMSMIATDEFVSLEGSLRSKLKPKNEASQIELGPSLMKVVKSLDILEQLKILPDLEGPAFEELKLSYPTIAFLNEWNDASLQEFLSSILPDELHALLRIRPDYQDRFLSLSSPMTQEVVRDELSGEDRSDEDQKREKLKQLNDRLASMVEKKEVNLSKVIQRRMESNELPKAA